MRPTSDDLLEPGRGRVLCQHLARQRDFLEVFCRQRQLDVGVLVDLRQAVELSTQRGNLRVFNVDLGQAGLRAGS